MTSTEHVNLDRYIQTFRAEDEICEANQDTALLFVDTVAAEGISESQQRKYLFCMKTLLTKFAPDGFRLDDAEEQNLRQIMAAVHRSDYSDSVKRMLAITLKRFYKLQNGGEVPDMADFIDTTEGKGSTVTRDDLFTERERLRLFSSFRNIRDQAYFKVLYESAARPGELHGCSLSDVEFSDKGDFIHLEGAKGTPDRTNQLIEAGQILRKLIKTHPAGGNPHDLRDPTAPLWVKEEQPDCRHCGATRQGHDRKGCDNYEPLEYQRVPYSSLYRSFKRACEKAEIGSHRPYDFRHTRITEAAQFMSHEQLCKFAGWKPGSNRARVYVHLINDDVNRAIREEYGLETADEGNGMVRCQVCGAKNEGGDFECRNCKRPLSLEKSEKQEELQQAVEIYNRLEEAGGIENLQKLEKLMANAEKIEELVET